VGERNVEREKKKKNKKGDSVLKGG